ncbi:MAG: dihydroorotase family protein [Desulfurococcaceae archaeon]
MRLLVRNVKVVVGDAVVAANVLVEDDRIAYVGKLESEADEVIDGEGQLAVPGGIDVHAHVYDPDPRYLRNEDWSSGSLAAAFGGLTTIVDMPLRTYVDNVEVLRKKVEEAAKNSYVNFGVTGGFMNESNVGAVYELYREGVRTFKAFTARPFRADDYAMVKVLEAVAEVGGVAIIHAEDDALIELGEQKYKDRKDPLAYHLHRTGSAEASALFKVGLYGKEVGARVHIAHMSSSEGVEALRLLARLGARVTAEVCPHHLFFTRDDVHRLGNYIKVAPTLKSTADRDALWRGLADGTIGLYASDNAPAPKEEKEKDPWSAWGGIPNLEIMLPFLYTYGVRDRRIDLWTFTNVTSRNPARLLGIYPERGEIAPNSVADLAILETRRPRKISASTHHHKVDWTPWEGLELYGWPLHLIVNGRPIIVGGELVGKPGNGRFVTRPR